jgi:hypothetical protein
MRQRGRKSSASLAVLPLPPGKRQPPPASLSKEEAAEWVAIVNRMPGGWFGRETHALLTAFCRHTVEADRLSGMLAVLDDTLAEAAHQGRHEFDLICESLGTREQLLRLRNAETRSLNAVARAMRLTQQSAFGNRAAATAQRHEGPSPWAPHEWKPKSERDGD